MFLARGFGLLRTRSNTVPRRLFGAALQYRVRPGWRQCTVRWMERPDPRGVL